MKNLKFLKLTIPAFCLSLALCQTTNAMQRKRNATKNIMSEENLKNADTMDIKNLQQCIDSLKKHKDGYISQFYKNNVENFDESKIKSPQDLKKTINLLKNFMQKVLLKDIKILKGKYKYINNKIEILAKKSHKSSEDKENLEKYKKLLNIVKICLDGCEDAGEKINFTGLFKIGKSIIQLINKISPDNDVELDNNDFTIDNDDSEFNNSDSEFNDHESKINNSGFKSENNESKVNNDCFKFNNHEKHLATIVQQKIINLEKYIDNVKKYKEEQIDPFYVENVQNYDASQIKNLKESKDKINQLENFIKDVKLKEHINMFKSKYNYINKEIDALNNKSPKSPNEEKLLENYIILTEKLGNFLYGIKEYNENFTGLVEIENTVESLKGQISVDNLYFKKREKDEIREDLENMNSTVDDLMDEFYSIGERMFTISADIKKNNDKIQSFLDYIHDQSNEINLCFEKTQDISLEKTYVEEISKNINKFNEFLKSEINKNSEKYWEEYMQNLYKKYEEIVKEGSALKEKIYTLHKNCGNYIKEKEDFFTGGLIDILRKRNDYNDNLFAQTVIDGAESYKGKLPFLIESFPLITSNNDADKEQLKELNVHYLENLIKTNKDKFMNFKKSNDYKNIEDFFIKNAIDPAVRMFDLLYEKVKIFKNSLNELKNKSKDKNFIDLNFLEKEFCSKDKNFCQNPEIIDFVKNVINPFLMSLRNHPNIIEKYKEYRGTDLNKILYSDDIQKKLDKETSCELSDENFENLCHSYVTKEIESLKNKLRNVKNLDKENEQNEKTHILNRIKFLKNFTNFTILNHNFNNIKKSAHNDLSENLNNKFTLIEKFKAITKLKILLANLTNLENKLNKMKK